MYEAFRTSSIYLSSVVASNYLMPMSLFFSVVGIILSIGIICGNRLAVIHIPHRQLLSPLLRHVGIAALNVSKVTSITLFIIAGFAIVISYFGWTLFISIEAVYMYGGFLIIGSAIGVTISLPAVYRWLPILERGDGLDDVENLAARLKKLARGYDPEKYFDISRGFFLGLDDKRRPVRVKKEVIQKNHIQIVGESGTGKSSLAGILSAQCAMLKESVIIFDPKNDVYLPSVLARIAKKYNIPFYLLDLRPSSPPQINPLSGCEQWEVEELLVAAFELGKTGVPGADFYRGEDRDACLEMAVHYTAGAQTIPQLFQACSKNPSITGRTNLWREFRQFTTLPAFHAKEGLDLKNIIDNGGILYVIGSTTSDKVFAAQRLMLQRILQIIASRKIENARPVAILLEELKYVLSAGVLRGLSTIRDKACHILLNHQSLQDLEDCAGLPPRAVRGAVHGNTSIKVVYKLNEFETAQQFEGVGGMERTFVENINTTDEHNTRGWRESERPRIRADLLTHLPKPVSGESSVGVLFGLGTAQLISTRYLTAGETPKVVAAEADEAPMTAEELI